MKLKTMYLAAPIQTYSTDSYDQAIVATSRYFPGSAVLPCRGMFASSAAWLRAWPAIVKKIDGLVFITDPHGYIGRGVAQEIIDAEQQGKPVYYLPWTACYCHAGPGATSGNLARAGHTGSA